MLDLDKGRPYNQRMCNCYDLATGKDRWHEDLGRQIGSAVPHLDKPLNIRKTDPGLVLCASGAGREAVAMRWGFFRHFNPAVNNARSDKLDSGMWAGSWEARRCVIPLAAYYEWSGPKGRKQAHAFAGEPGHWLWAAGVWEEHAEQGRCFAMITVDANEVTRPIHQRMPALLACDALDEFLDSDDPRELLCPYRGQLQTFPCRNPLKMEPPRPPVAMEIDRDLFGV